MAYVPTIYIKCYIHKSVIKVTCKSQAITYAWQTNIAVVTDYLL